MIDELLNKMIQWAEEGLTGIQQTEEYLQGKDENLPYLKLVKAEKKMQVIYIFIKGLRNWLREEAHYWNPEELK